MKHLLLTAAAMVCLAVPAGPTLAANIKILSWNLESDGSDPAILAKQIVDLGKRHLYCFQEVSSRDAGRYAFAIREAFGQNYRYLVSNTGRDDRLMILYNADRFDLVEARELFKHGEYNLNKWRHRSPLVLVLKEKQSGLTFNLMTVHLARGDRQFRKEQAIGLREWARAQPLPTVAIGDFNFDYDIPGEQGNASFQAFLEEGTWTWVKPTPMQDTNYDDRDGDGVDDYPDSCLDFAFVAGEGFGRAEAKILVRDGDFPDDDRTSDHRPIELTLSP
ncbi:MAG: endonuclease/exonuclease/phosphatase family protein [Planctomycetota bacterium]